RIGPLVSILLLAGLVTYVYLYEIRGKAETDKSASDKDRPLSFERANLKAIGITNEHGTLRLEKQGDTWKVTQPLASDAHKDAVEGLVNSLEIARVDRRLGAGEDRKAYGLDPPKATVVVETTAAGEPPRLLIGDGSPIGGSFYALLPGTNEVAVVGSSIGDVA